MTGASLLTQGLEPLREAPGGVCALHSRLLALDEQLQAAHQRAKRDDDFGEDVVAKYTAFLACRRELVAELERQELPVPWQLRMTIDDLELTLKQRKEKKEGKTAKPQAAKQEKHTGGKPKDTQEEPATLATCSGRATCAFVFPTLGAVVVAVVWYHWFS